MHKLVRFLAFRLGMMGIFWFLAGFLVVQSAICNTENTGAIRVTRLL